jgi:hypothetical protein
MLVSHSLPVASKAIVRVPLVAMALYTESHLEVMRKLYTIHSRHIAVAFATVKTGAEMGLVDEKHIVRKRVYALPLHGFLFLIVGPQIPNLRMFRDDSAVAEHACLQRRYPGVGRIERARVTHHATEPFLAYVQPVAEGDRLINPRLTRVVEEVSVDH